MRQKFYIYKLCSLLKLTKATSVTRLGDLLDFGQLLKRLAPIILPKSLHILRQFL